MRAVAALLAAARRSLGAPAGCRSSWGRQSATIATAQGVGPLAPVALRVLPTVPARQRGRLPGWIATSAPWLDGPTARTGPARETTIRSCSRLHGEPCPAGTPALAQSELGGDPELGRRVRAQAQAVHGAHQRLDATRGTRTSSTGCVCCGRRCTTCRGVEACHGQEPRRLGSAGVSLQTCHPSGVMACNTCHGSAANAAPPGDLDYLSATSLVTVGAHQSHGRGWPAARGVRLRLGATRTPSQPGDEGHYQSGGKLITGPAPVHRGQRLRGRLLLGPEHGQLARTAIASRAVPGRERLAEQPDSSGPRWVRTRRPAGSCHGNPPPVTGPDTRCQTCHRPSFIGDQPRLARSHSNGERSISRHRRGAASGATAAATTRRPPVDVLGRSDPALQTVGAHRRPPRGAAQS
jgi:hypothetical protein